MQEMIDFFKICRPVTEEMAYTSPYLYTAYKYNLPHIRVISAGEVGVRYKGNPLPAHVLNFIQQHDLVMVVGNIVRNYLVQIVIRGIKEKGFTVFSPTIVPFYGLGRMSPDFKYGDAITLVEGILDYESIHRFFPNTLGVLTASLSTYQLDILETLTNRVILCLDNDPSGIRGSKKAHHKLKEKGINVDYVKYPSTMKDPGNLLELEMQGDVYTLSFYESLMKVQLAQLVG